MLQKGSDARAPQLPNLTPFKPKSCRPASNSLAPNLTLDPHLLPGYVASAALYAERAGSPRPGSSSWSDFFWLENQTTTSKSDERNRTARQKRTPSAKIASVERPKDFPRKIPTSASPAPSRHHRKSRNSARNSPRTQAAFARLVTTGIVNENRLPRPTSLSTHKRPPCASTIPLAIARPSPTPRRSEERACQ